MSPGQSESQREFHREAHTRSRIVLKSEWQGQDHGECRGQTAARIESAYDTS